MNEEREREERGLNELPEGTFEMKGNRYPPSEEEYYIPNIPADIGAALPIGDIPQVSQDRSSGANVRSTYDTRPINGTDFHYSVTNTVTPNWDGDVISLFTFTVPESYLAVLRGFEYAQYPYNLGNTAIGPEFTPKISILVNGITQLGHSNFSMEADATPQRTHVIAPEKSELVLRIVYPQFYSVNIDYSVWVHLYGNLILTSNRPPAFEVGNETPSKVLPVPKEITGPADFNPGPVLSHGPGTNKP